MVFQIILSLLLCLVRISSSVRLMRSLGCPTISGALEEGKSEEAENCFEFLFTWREKKQKIEHNYPKGIGKYNQLPHLNIFKDLFLILAYLLCFTDFLVDSPFVFLLMTRTPLLVIFIYLYKFRPNNIFVVVV